MRFALNDDQAMIAETVTRMFGEAFDRATLTGFARDGAILDSWRKLIGESGLLGICAPEQAGGLGLGVVDALAIAREAGAHAVPFPVSEGIVAAVALGGRPDIACDVIAARSIAVIADADAGVTGAQQEEGVRLSGHVAGLGWAAEADLLIVDAEWGNGSIRRCAVRLDSPLVRLEPRRSIDLTTPSASIRLDDAPAELLGDADVHIGRLRTILAAAEREGAARTCLSLAVAYMKERQQFGQEIGRFQSLKHIVATDALQIESMSVANAYAAWSYDAGASDAEEALHIAKSFASEAARTVAEDSIQCHGGIGFTWDYGLHLYLRRILRLGALCGTAQAHRGAMIAELITAQDAQREQA
ncbi:MAG: acyl-CoA dehydrogenase family protein [Sphingomicrobium sp.]